MKRTKGKVSNQKAKTRKLVIRTTIFFFIFAVFTVAYYNIPALKAKEINGTVLKGILAESIVLTEPDGPIKLGQGESYTFDVYLKYTDKNGNTAQEEISDKSELEIRASDPSVCTRTEYNVIQISDEVATGTIFTVSLSYEDQSTEYTFMVAYSLEDTIANGVVTNPDDNAVLVNAKRKLPSKYKPDDMVEPSIQYRSTVDDDNKYLRLDAAIAAEKLFLAAKNQGFSLIALKGYATSSSDPEHQTGLALDVSSITSYYSTGSAFANSTEGKWITENAAQYGFVLRYPSGKESVTGMNDSPSHLRYVGVELASYLYEHDLTLEEYFAR